MNEPREGEKPVEPIIAQSFEGVPVTLMEGVLPMVTLEMPEGYPLGTHLRFEVEVRVANVRYEEGKGRHRGDFSRKHVLMTEGVELIAAFIPSELDSAVVGSAAGLADLVEDEDEEPQAEQLPLDPAFQDADTEVPGAVETLDEQISRLAEEEAEKISAADSERLNERLETEEGVYSFLTDTMGRGFSVMGGVKTPLMTTGPNTGTATTGGSGIISSYDVGF